MRSVLKVETDELYDFLLIGIVCHYKDYRLCFELNNCLNINLSKQNDLEIMPAKKMQPDQFSFFKQADASGNIFHLLSNKGGKGSLIPEQKQMDYFFLVKERIKNINPAELVKSIKEIPIVLGAFALNPLKLKSAENLVF